MQNRMKQEKVFLVIDNVTDGYSLGEAREYLKAGFPRESKIIITSRSRHIVEGLLFESKLRKLRMPYITGEVGTVNFLKMECTDWIIKELMRKVMLEMHSCSPQPANALTFNPHEAVLKIALGMPSLVLMYSNLMVQGHSSRAVKAVHLFIFKFLI